MSMNLFMFCCQEGNRPECISINGTPSTLPVCKAPLMMSTVSGIILMLTSLSLRVCKMLVMRLRSLLSTTKITSSIFSLSIIDESSRRPMYCLTCFGNSVSSSPLVLRKVVMRYPESSLALENSLYKANDFLPEPTIAVLKKTVFALSCFFAADRNNIRMISVRQKTGISKLKNS